MEALAKRRLQEPTPLERLAVEIAEAHSAATSAFGSSLEHARRAGDKLIEAKGLVEHGEWGDWLGSNFPATDRTARMYMRIAEKWESLPPQNGNAFPISEANKLLANPRNTSATEPSIPGLSFRRKLTAMHSAMDAFDPEHLDASDLASLEKLAKRILRFIRGD